MADIDPTKTFYQAFTVSGMSKDATLDVDNGHIERTEAEIIAAVEAMIAEDGTGSEETWIVYECIPRKRVFRPKIAIEEFDSPRSPRSLGRPRKTRAAAREPVTCAAVSSEQTTSAEPVMLGGQHAIADPLAAARDVVEAEQREPDAPGFLLRTNGETK